MDFLPSLAISSPLKLFLRQGQAGRREAWRSRQRRPPRPRVCRLDYGGIRATRCPPLEI